MTTSDDFLAGLPNEQDWSTFTGLPAAITPLVVQFGNGADAFEVALAESDSAPKAEDVRNMFKVRWNKRAAPVLAVVAYPVSGPDGQQWRASVCGTRDDPAVTHNLDLSQLDRMCRAALEQPDGLAAERTIRRLLDGTKDCFVDGGLNRGLFATHELRTGVPARPDWAEAGRRATPMLRSSGAALIRALGYSTTPIGSTAHVLADSGNNDTGVAILLDATEVFERPSSRFGALSPVASGIAAATRRGLPWLIVTRGTQIRLYPTRPNVGVGRKGPAETYLELDLATLADHDAAYLTLIFSPEALAERGTVSQILANSANYSAALGKRLRERIYVDLVPDLAVAIGNTMEPTGRASRLTEADLHEAYHRTLIVLFRLLFTAYAEDRGLLPVETNPRYQRKSLRVIARDLTEDPNVEFSDEATDLWEDLQAVWRAIDDGNSDWDVPAYNGGLFAANDLHPSGQALAATTLTNAQIGPALRALLVDINEDGDRGPVDFRAITVREFGTIYEGLLESSLSVADQDLTIGSRGKNRGAYLPAQATDQVVVPKGAVYFHNASGQRKATGSYFTKEFAVEHLLDTALDPALDSHLAHVRTLAETDEAAAFDLLFDFRVADLAMGSAHFLVAAIDRIEAKFRSFLSEMPIPRVMNELAELKAAAEANLAPENSLEVEPASVLRRQIARRCIYGLDLNLMAVELARLAIWIHTFVPGLPMSALNHGLRVGNSLTGIGTLDEARSVFEPDAADGQESLFAAALNASLEEAQARLRRVALTSEATKRDVHDAEREYERARQDAANANSLFNAAVAIRMGAPLVASPEGGIALGEAAETKSLVERLGAVHLPSLFPEVFVRERPGFDVLIGNPPWEKIRHEPQQFWVIRDPGLRALPASARERRIKELRVADPIGANEEEREIAARALLRTYFANGYELQRSQHYDFAKVFAERNLALVRDGGAFGIVLPQASLVLGGWAPIRDAWLSRGHLKVMPIRNRGEWMFENVHPQLTVALLGLGPGGGVRVHAAVDGLAAFTAESERPGLAMSTDELKALSDESNIPWFENPSDPGIFTIMAAQPSLASGEGWVTGEADSTRWDFSGSGRHKAHASETRSPGAWRVTMTRHVDAYALSDDAEGRRIPRPHDLAPLGLGVKVERGKALLSDEHPALVYRFPTNNDNSRTLIATALPEEGWLYSKGYAHGVRMPKSVSTHDRLALLGFLNSIAADWWARRFVDRHLGKRIINGMPLPDWSAEQRDAAAVDVSRLLRLSGYQRLAGGIDLSSISDSQETLGREELLARLDALALHGFGLSATDALTIMSDFEASDDALPAARRTAILDLLKDTA